jgi:hypothetical protein
MHATHDDLSIPSGKKDFSNRACAELTIGDLLADPLTGALMRADRVDMDDFREMLRSVSWRLHAARTPSRPTVKFTGDAKPYPPISVVGISAGQSESGAMRSTQAPAAGKAAKTSCGSHCPW